MSAPIRGAPLVFGDRVFTISIDNKLHAMAAVDGSDLWSFSALQEVAGYVGGNSPAGSGDIVVAPFTSGELVGLRARQRPHRSGTNRWSAPRRELRAFGNLADIRGRPVIDRGLVLAMGSAGTLTAIDLRSGQRMWERNIGGNQTPWVAGRFVFVVTGAADVAALERDTGKVKWVTPLTQYQDEKRRKPIHLGGPGAGVRPAAGRRLDRRDAGAVALYRRDHRQARHALADAAGAGGGQPHGLRPDRQSGRLIALR